MNLNDLIKSAYISYVFNKKATGSSGKIFYSSSARFSLIIPKNSFHMIISTIRALGVNLSTAEIAQFQNILKDNNEFIISKSLKSICRLHSGKISLSSYPELGKENIEFSVELRTNTKHEQNLSLSSSLLGRLKTLDASINILPTQFDCDGSQKSVDVILSPNILNFRDLGIELNKFFAGLDPVEVSQWLLNNTSTIKIVALEKTNDVTTTTPFYQLTGINRNDSHTTAVAHAPSVAAHTVAARAPVQTPARTFAAVAPR